MERSKAQFGYKVACLSLSSLSTANLLRTGHFPKSERLQLIRKAARRAIVTLEELQRFIAHVGESVDLTASSVLHKSGTKQ